MRIALFLFILPIAVAGVQAVSAAKQTVAVLPSEGVLSDDELEFFTDKAQEIAVRVLPKNGFEVFPQDIVIKRLGGFDSYVKECKESSCIVDLGRKAKVDYVAQCRFGKLGSDFRITFELYKVSTSGLIDKFSESAEDINGLLAIMQEKIPDGFMKIPGASSQAKSVLPPVAGGIRNLERAVDYEFDDEKRYLATINTEPQGAALSFDGLPDDKCSRTPCKTERPEGDVRIIARLEQYETADTTVSVKQNNQNIAIALKPNFGVLEINPAYSDGIGTYRQWSLAINDKPYPLGEIRLSPGSYAVKLNHECYENISFTAGIQKGKREVFDMARHIVLKKGGLVLRAERNGQPASEPVFVNGRHAGETPFSGSVPLCAEIEVGKNRENVDVGLKHNGKVEHVVSETKEQRVERERQEAEALREAEERREQERREREEQREREAEMREAQAAWYSWLDLSIGLPLMINSVDTLYKPTGTAQFSLRIGGLKANADFFRFGGNIDFGILELDKSAIREKHPNDVIKSIDWGAFLKFGAFARLYPVNAWYFSGGTSFDRYMGYYAKTDNGEQIDGPGTSAVAFTIGTGFILGEVFLEAQYHILPFNRNTRYVSINIGVTGKSSTYMEKINRK